MIDQNELDTQEAYDDMLTAIGHAIGDFEQHHKGEVECRVSIPNLKLRSNYWSGMQFYDLEDDFAERLRRQA